ncbi:hypothetical protein WAF17_13025 [Bernardetia sp. ABR2-2B]|uniref:hypothetical protein n=1 Tax=Bernardetia sp. ABR2-2B TaxID=3127472 RepID=UPI0030D3CE45
MINSHIKSKNNDCNQYADKTNNKKSKLAKIIKIRFYIGFLKVWAKNGKQKQPSQAINKHYYSKSAFKGA